MTPILPIDWLEPTIGFLFGCLAVIVAAWLSFIGIALCRQHRARKRFLRGLGTDPFYRD